MRTELHAHALAARHPRTPLVRKARGRRLVDDLIVVPLAIAVAIRFVSARAAEECRSSARQRVAASKVNWRLVVAVWALLGAIGVALAI